MKILVLTGLAFSLTGCVTAVPGCDRGLSPMVEARLFFGDQIAARGMVSAAQWQQFVDSEVTPRFPDGFTVLTTMGQWRASNGMITRETGHELVIVFSPAAAAAQKLDAIRTAYKQRFMQDSVLLAESPACAGV
jgi:hypothetical protein